MTPEPQGDALGGHQAQVEQSVADISDEELLRRAVKNARSYRSYHARWTAVADAFCLGSTYSHQLCRRFGLDPAERVRR